MATSPTAMWTFTIPHGRGRPLYGLRTGTLRLYHHVTMMNLIEHRIAVPVSGGRVLSGHVWRPRDSGRWPAIIDASPYRAGDIFRPLLEPQLRYFAEHGYAAIAI